MDAMTFVLHLVSRTPWLLFQVCFSSSLVQCIFTTSYGIDMFFLPGFVEELCCNQFGRSLLLCLLRFVLYGFPWLFLCSDEDRSEEKNRRHEWLHDTGYGYPEVATSTSSIKFPFLSHECDFPCMTSPMPQTTTRIQRSGFVVSCWTFFAIAYPPLHGTGKRRGTLITSYSLLRIVYHLSLIFLQFQTAGNIPPPSYRRYLNSLFSLGYYKPYHTIYIGKAIYKKKKKLWHPHFSDDPNRW